MSPHVTNIDLDDYTAHKQPHPMDRDVDIPVEPRLNAPQRPPAHFKAWRGVFIALMLLIAMLGVCDVGLNHHVAGFIGFVLALLAIGVATRKWSKQP